MNRADRDGLARLSLLHPSSNVYSFTPVIRIFLKSPGACRCEAVYAEAAPTQARRLLHAHRALVRNDIAADFKKRRHVPRNTQTA
jgi:hypothetical protein